MRLRDTGLSVQELDGSIVVLDLESSRYLTISQTGTALWHLLERGTDQDEMAAALVDTFGLSPTDAAQDVEAFIFQLRKADLLSRRG